MPRAKKQTPLETPPSLQPYKSDSDADWFGFINIRVSDSQEVEFKSLNSEYLQWLRDQLDQALILGFKLSVVMDVEHDCYIATLTGCVTRGLQSRACLSARNDTMQGALDLLIFKHVVILQSDWGKYQPSTGKVKFG